MTYNCEITIENVKSLKRFKDILITMLNDYEDMNEDSCDYPVTISIKEKNITIRIYYGNNTLEIGYCDIR